MNQVTQTLTVWVTLVALIGCAESSSYGDESSSRSEGFEKADISAGPIEQLNCSVEEPFVRRGGFARFEVKALDRDGLRSRNYELRVSPELGHRVVQRDQVIFDLDGLYTVSCCALDSARCDEVAVRVGSEEPALNLSIPPFSVGESTLRGRALDRAGKAARVTVNGQRAPQDEEGRFEIKLPTDVGLNRFEVIATGSEGATSSRRAWTVGGPFVDVSSIDPAAARVSLSEQSYPQLSRLLTELFAKLVRDYERSDDFKEAQTGSSAGYAWEVSPRSIEIGNASVTLRRGARAGELELIVDMPRFTIWADGLTRFAGGEWKEREVMVSADIYIELPISPHAEGFTIGDVKTQVEELDLEISDMPSLFEGLLELLFERRFQRELVEIVESVGDRGLSDILTGFEVNERLELPEPLSAALELKGRVVELRASEAGVTLGVGLSIDGETDPARAQAPGPILTSAAPPQLQLDRPYEASLHLDLLNRLLFAAWQTGGLDFITTVEQPLGDDDELWSAEALTIFVTPALPPVVSLGERDGELKLELGALRVDGVLETQVAVLNCALELGLGLRVMLNGGADQVSVNGTTELIEADVLIPPAGWELEPTRRLIEGVIARDVAPKYSEIFKQLPIPTVDLSGLGLEGIQRLSVTSLELSTPQNSVSVSAELELK